ncbi:MAG TPA: lipopolysaccharide transport periplasmic protein LptA [Steroidobacteraceae bacterium]|nr:lipopolysaccharide transport periplasmic protein LptA [Steroidobacteraceae bacterium]
MALSRASRIAATLLAGSAALAPPARGASPLQLNDAQPIQLEARSSDFDYKNNTLLFHGVRIAQGALAIEADEATATGLDFKDSRWLFTGNVRITLPDGSLSADQARIAFAANLIASAEISGTPARFEQKRDKDIARGRALHIEYLPASGTVRLTEDAWLSDGNNEISAQTLVYDMPHQRVLANPDEQGGQPVHFTINPKKPDAKPESKSEAKPDAKPEPKSGEKPEP